MSLSRSHRSVPLHVHAALVLGALFLVTAPALAGDCSLLTLQGKYIWTQDGFSQEETGFVPFAYTGSEQYDGAGNLAGVYSGSYGGEVDSAVAYTGTYTVNQDCSGTLATTDAFGETSTYAIYIDPATGDFVFAGTSQGITTQGFNRKVR